MKDNLHLVGAFGFGYALPMAFTRDIKDAIVLGIVSITFLFWDYKQKFK
jgi:hypothetical protein